MFFVTLCWGTDFDKKEDKWEKKEEKEMHKLEMFIFV